MSGKRKSRWSDKDLLDGKRESALLYELPESLTMDEKFRVMFWKRFYQKIMLLFIVIPRGEYFCKFWIGVCREGSYSHIHLLHTFNRSTMKINRRVLFPCAHVTDYDFLGFIESFFLKLCMRIFPGQATTAIDEENQFKEGNWTSSLIENIFLANQRAGIQTLLELVL